MVSKKRMATELVAWISSATFGRVSMPTTTDMVKKIIAIVIIVSSFFGSIDTVKISEKNAKMNTIEQTIKMSKPTSHLPGCGVKK